VDNLVSTLKAMTSGQLGRTLLSLAEIAETSASARERRSAAYGVRMVRDELLRREFVV
jgi:hypothetical protein